MIIDHANEDDLFICTTGIGTTCTPSTLANGVDAAGNDYAGYFAGNIGVTGSCSGCVVATFGLNVGQSDLQPGDIVTIQGAQKSGVDSVAMLMEVTAGSAGQAVVGVVQGWAELVTVEEPRPDETGQRLVPREGSAAPGEYVTIVTHGPMPVRASALGTAVTAGDKLAVNESGAARAVQSRELDGMLVYENGPSVGIALQDLAAGEEDLIWVLVNPQ